MGFHPGFVHIHRWIVLLRISLTILQLIISRIFQGIGSAMLLSLTPTVISASFPHMVRGKYLDSFHLQLPQLIHMNFEYIALVTGVISQYPTSIWFLFAAPTTSEHVLKGTS